MTLTVSLKELIESGAHFGHQVRRWNPKMEQFLYGEKDGVHVFDLPKTKAKLEEALEAIKEATANGKKVLFLGTKKQAKEMIAKTAKESGSFYVNERWLGGTLTNFDMIKRSVKSMKDIEKGLELGEYKTRTKKERLLLERELERLHRFFGGLDGIDTKPDMLVIIDVKREKTAVKEANATGVDVVGIVDSNSDPDGVNYPIPMNDDASKALMYVLGLMNEAILEGSKIEAKNKAVRSKAAKSETK
jgi:small subunit ribosomal protein S2